MDRVPSWTELIQHANYLMRVQHDCYQSVHHMLEKTIPELDEKISILDGNYSVPQRQPPKIEAIEIPILRPVPRSSSRDAELQQKPPQTIPRSVSSIEILQPKASSAKDRESNEAPLLPAPTDKDDTIPMLLPAKPRIPKSQTHSGLMCFSPPPPRRKPNGPSHKKSQKKSKQLKPTLEKQPKSAKYELDMDELEHIRPPPMTPSEYLKLNRPDLYNRANERRKYIQETAKKRRQSESARMVSSFSRLRLSSRNSMNSLSSYQQQTRQPAIREHVVPEYRVKCKLSEQEMKRLTAKTWKRLPEVKKRRSEEMTNHMKVQNYKNKQEYGRKLLENRRRGIINYPLKSSCENTSMVSSQDDSLNGSFGPDSLNAFKSY